jgi:hypothetical protein
MNTGMSKLLGHIVPPMIAGFLVIGGSLMVLYPGQGEDQAEDIEYPADSFQVVMGSGRSTGNILFIDGYENDMAIASSGPVNIQSGSNHLLRFDIKTDQSAYVPIFFWRQKGNQQEVSRIELPATGPQLIDLKLAQNWTGDIVEFGFFFEDPQGHAAELSGVSLEGISPGSFISLVFHEWYQLEPWSQRSINFLYGGAQQQRIPLPLVLLTWVFLSILIFVLLNFGQKNNALKFAAVIFLIAWMILDLRWTNNRLGQASDSIANLLTASDQERLEKAFDGDLYEYISRLKREVLSENPGRIVLIGDESVVEYILLKAKYHLLPHSAAVRQQLDESISPEYMDYVLVFRSYSDQEQALSSTATHADLLKHVSVSGRWREKLELLDIGEFGFLFAVPDTKGSD